MNKLLCIFDVIFVIYFLFCFLPGTPPPRKIQKFSISPELEFYRNKTSPLAWKVGVNDLVFPFSVGMLVGEEFVTLQLIPPTKNRTLMNLIKEDLDWESDGPWGAWWMENLTITGDFTLPFGRTLALALNQEEAQFVHLQSLGRKKHPKTQEITEGLLRDKDVVEFLFKLRAIFDSPIYLCQGVWRAKRHLSLEFSGGNPGSLGIYERWVGSSGLWGVGMDRVRSFLDGRDTQFVVEAIPLNDRIIDWGSNLMPLSEGIFYFLYESPFLRRLFYPFSWISQYIF